MTDKHANDLRLYANDIMHQLYVAGKRDQLDLLRKYAEIAVQEIDREEKEMRSE